MSKEKNLIQQNITDILKTNYMPYAMSVIVSRAIPEIDGFKPAHRKLLFTLYEMGLLKSKRVKSADAVGQTMRLNPHGDGAIYETLVRLTRGNDALLHPFIDSKGNFGKHTSKDMAYAAPRYTEVKLDSICEELFRDIDKNTVDFIDNYNGTTKEPILFPTTFPNVLVTANLGIAVGMASSICSFNLKEVCETTIQYLKNPDFDLKKYLPGPDFSTGGDLIYNPDETDNIYATGRGSFKLRGKYKVDKKNSCIEIYEIPYTTNVESIIEKIISLVKSNKIKDITDVRNETDLHGMKITIDIKKNTDVNVLMSKIYSMTSLQDTFSCNFNILIEGKPMTLGIKDILYYWVDFRIKCIRRQVEFDIIKKDARLHLLSGLSKIVLDIDKAIKIIRETEHDNLVIQNLIDGFSIDKIQADYVSEIKLRNLNKEYLLNKTKEIESLRNEIEYLKNILTNEKSVKDIIISQLKEVSKKHKKERRTQIISEEIIEKFSEDDLIEDYPVKLFFTKHNYFKKITNVSLRSASEQNIKEDDEMFLEIDSTNKSDILFFSNKQNVYKLKGYDISDCKASNLGEYLPNMLKLDENEYIIFIVTTIDYSGHILFAFENGKFSKITLQSYFTKVNRRKLINAFYDKSNCIFVDYLSNDTHKDYLIVRDWDRALLISSSLVAEKTTKNSSGLQVFNLKKGSLISTTIDSKSFESDDIEYYRSSKIPSAGHFLVEKDKLRNRNLVTN